jgi:spermidine synthase
MTEKNNIWNWFKSYFTNIEIETISTSLNPSLQVCLSEGKYILHSAADNFSYSSLDPAFCKVFRKLKIKERDINNILLLGVGSGSLVKVLQHDFKLNAAITGVEKDAEIIKLAHKYFRLSSYRNFTLVQDDVIHFLENEGHTYDLVISEVFSGLHVPETITSSSYLTQLKKVLAPKGLLIYTMVVGDKGSKKTAKAMVEKFENIFGKPKVNKIWEFWKTWLITYENQAEDQ